MQVHTHTHTYIHTYIYTYAPTCTHTHIFIHAYIHTHTYIHTDLVLQDDLDCLLFQNGQQLLPCLSSLHAAQAGKSYLKVINKYQIPNIKYRIPNVEYQMSNLK